MKKIWMIPVKAIEDVKRKLRVAAYCRVSTKMESQRSSIELQKRYYRKLIKDNPDWIYTGVFFDYGSGLRRKERLQFEKMIEKALNGKIDYIITKSISRASRNTLDLLIIIRMLRERGINMFFEKENLNSIEEDKEFIISVLASVGQQESNNMSKNIQWGYQRKFEKGDIFKKYKNFMGYQCVNEEIVIVEEEAEVVRKIFKLYLEGLTVQQIKEYLEEHKIKTVTGKDIWSAKTIYNMLKNEKYKGDSMLQKTYAKDYLTGQRGKNIGQKNRYYVYNSHPAIITDEIFERVQLEMKKRARLVHKENGEIEASNRKYSGKYMLGNLLVCGECGASYRRRTERGKVVWRCGTRVEKGKEACSKSPTINEDELKTRLAKAVCKGGEYEEKLVRNVIEEIVVCVEDIEIKLKDGNVDRKQY